MQGAIFYIHMIHAAEMLAIYSGSVLAYKQSA